MAQTRSLDGLRILIAEDNLFAAMELEQAVSSLGCQAVGPVARVQQALELAQEQQLDGALLDVDLRGEMVFPVADELVKRGVPVVFASGYDSGPVFPDRFAGHPRLRKPYLENEVKRMVQQAFSHRPASGGGSA